MALYDLGLDDLAVIFLRIQAHGLAPTLKAILVVYPLLHCLRLALIFARAGHYNIDRIEDLYLDAREVPFREKDFDMHWVYVLYVVRESFWLFVCFAITPESAMDLWVMVGTVLGLVVVAAVMGCVMD
ncbi:hypothetical protein LTR10_001606 [Elasticomyces elasticus]|nr:hypothetical protein LTR10_001606 [Elasticomyces elasticus]KAK4975110.1 hypothetical protein LTR42_004320 [Elasticomyces elasticus]